MEIYNVFARFYDLFTDDVDYHRRAKYFNEIIMPHIGEQKLLLDLACGTGSLSVEFSKMGYDVIGVDASVEMLYCAGQKAREQEQKILFLNQTMQGLDLYGTINACVCALDSLNHLPNTKELKNAIKKVALFLEPGGVFVFDMNTPFKHRTILADNSFIYENSDVICLWRNDTHDLKTTISLDFLEKTSKGLYQRFSESFCEQGFEMETVVNILSQCGLTLLAVYDDDSFNKPNEQTQRWVFVASKEK